MPHFGFGAELLVVLERVLADDALAARPTCFGKRSRDRVGRMPGSYSIGAPRTIVVPAPTRGWIALRQRPSSGFTLGSAACACDAARIATTRCIGAAERTQMPSPCIYDF
jgi:hypothetical protein